jgi:hypothetical protein
VIVAFAVWRQALEASEGLPRTAMLLNALCLLEAPVAARMPWPAGSPPADGADHRLLLLAAPDCREVLPAWLGARGGRVLWRAPEGERRGMPLRELTWNHTTLHWRSAHGDWTYLQMLLPDPAEPLLSTVRHQWGEDVLWHLEGVRQQGRPRLAALPLLRWRGAEALQELIDRCRDLGAVVFNPHVLTVEDGSLGVIDADQVAAKAAYDPTGLLNPGKLRGWISRSPG